MKSIGNIKLKPTILSIFLVFVLFASSLFVAKPAQSQQQGLTDSVLGDIQRGQQPYLNSNDVIGQITRHQLG